MLKKVKINGIVKKGRHGAIAPLATHNEPYRC